MCRGRAIELAGHDSNAVYPVDKRWKTHFGQRRFADKARYALVISLSAPGRAVDLHAEISNLVALTAAEILIGR